MNVPDRLDSVRVPDDLPKITAKADGKVPNATTYTLMRECHTIGNLVRMWVPQTLPPPSEPHSPPPLPPHAPPRARPLPRELLRDPTVKFAGYKHPHPLENDIQLKVQAHPGTTPNEVVISALTRLMDEATALRDSFRVQVAAQRAREEQIGV